MKPDTNLMFLFATFSLVAAFFSEHWAIAFVTALALTYACFYDLIEKATLTVLSRNDKQPLDPKLLHRVVELESEIKQLSTRVENLTLKTTLNL